MIYIFNILFLHTRVIKMVVFLRMRPVQQYFGEEIYTDLKQNSESQGLWF